MPVLADFKERIDNFAIWEAFQGINGGYTIGQFRNSDNFYIWQQILATVGGSGMDIKGSIDASANPNYPAGAVGDVYRISVAGKIGGAAGFKVSAGDTIICFVASAAGTQAAVGANWNIKQVGLQRVFEVDFTTGDITQTGLRDWNYTITRDVAANITGTQSGIIGGSDLWIIGANYSMAAVGTWSVSGTNFQVASTGIVSILGTRAITILNDGFDNCFVGRSAGTTTANNASNVGMGSAALSSLGNGYQNVAIGATALSACINGGGNTAVGYTALLQATSNDNTAIGSNALRSVVAATGNVALGLKAGYYETGSNKLFIDNAQRASEADGRLKALVYGIFDAATANQFFTVNGHVLVREDLQFTTKAIDTTSGDSATINSPAGRFRKDATGAAFTLTNSYITANSIIQCTPANAAIDVTATSWTVLAGAGSAVITFNAAPTAEFDMNFLVIN